MDDIYPLPQMRDCWRCRGIGGGRHGLHTKQSISIDRVPNGFKRAQEGHDSAMEFVCVIDGIIAEKTD